MMIPIYWGTRGKLKKDLSTGIDYCPNCGKYTGWFLGRSLKITHFEYIPLKTTTLAWFHMCGVCEHGKTLDEGQYNVLKQMYMPFSNKKQQIQCYEQAAAIAQTLPPEENSVNILMSRLAQTFPVSATYQLDAEYRRRCRRLLNIPEPEQQQEAGNELRSAAPAVMPDVTDIPSQNPYPAQNQYGAQNPYPMQNQYGAQNPYPMQNQYGVQNPYPAQNQYGAQNPYNTAPQVQQDPNANSGAEQPNQFTNGQNWDR